MNTQPQIPSDKEMEVAKTKGWWWQAFRDPRLLWASTTKLQSVLASLVASFVIIICTWRGSVPTFLPELMGVYLAAVILGRGASKYLSIWEGKEKKDVGTNP